MDFWTWFSIIYIFVAVTISFLFIEEKLRLVFMMIAFLLYVSIYNVHFSIKYYYKIRNEPGMKGDRGDPGDSGEEGSDGVCAMARSCGIASCRKLVVDELMQQFPEYIIIRDKLTKNVELNAKEKKQNRQINTYIDLLVAKCEVFEKTEDAQGNNNTVNDFKKIIQQTIN